MPDRVATDALLSARLLILASFLSAAVVLMRPISIVWMAGVVGVSLIGVSAVRRRQLLTRRLLVWAIAPTAVALVLSWLWALYAKIEVKDDRVVKASLSSALRRSVREWPGYFRQTVGVLGWLDTILPSFVYLAWFAALVIVVVVAIRSATPRGIAALAAIVGVWLALPSIINGFTNSRAGLTYQGRYSLPIFVGLVFLPMWGDRSTFRWPRLSQRSLVSAALALVVAAEVVGFWQMLRRFTVGAHGKVLLTGRLPWSPSIAPMLLVAINAAAMLVASWSAWRPWGEIEAAPGERHREGAEHGAH